MLIRTKLYCPTLKREVKLQISIPKDYKNSNVVFDSLYMLDGQNLFKDSDASFGRSLHMGKYLAIMSTKFNKRICGIAIYNAESDLGRINEYTPFKIDNMAEESWKKQDVSVCQAFTYDFINTIIPYIQNNYPVNPNPSNTYLFGSSLGALYASYIANYDHNLFGAVGLFSICTFLCDEPYYEFLNNNVNSSCRNFIYVGLNESSDGCYDQSLYYTASKKLHDFNKTKKVPSKLVVDYYGSHNEATWEKHALQFLSFIYFDDIEITL